MNTLTRSPAVPAGRLLRSGLWIAQAALAAAYVASGLMKLATPIAKLSATVPWAADMPETFVRFIGIVDLSAGLGILLPALTRVAPHLTVLAALGSSVLQLFAMAFHASRGEFAVLPVNLVLLILSLFVLWGRSRRVPIAPRGNR